MIICLAFKNKRTYSICFSLFKCHSHKLHTVHVHPLLLYMYMYLHYVYVSTLCIHVHVLSLYMYIHCYCTCTCIYIMRTCTCIVVVHADIFTLCINVHVPYSINLRNNGCSLLRHSSIK